MKKLIVSYMLASLFSIANTMENNSKISQITHVLGECYCNLHRNKLFNYKRYLDHELINLGEILNTT